MKRPAFTHPLGVSYTEWNVIRGAWRARALVSNGYFLVGTTKAANNAVDRLVAMKFVTRVKAQFTPPRPDWPVVKITNRNITIYNDALESAHAKTGGAQP